MSDRPYICYFEDCGKTFKKACDLDRHDKIHWKKKPYPCSWKWCGKTFTQETACRIHLNVHTGARPYACPYCDVRFGDPSSRSRHRARHLDGSSYKCLVGNCKHSTTRKDTLRDHLKSCHGLDVVLPRQPRTPSSKQVIRKAPKLTQTERKTTSRKTTGKAKFLSSAPSPFSNPGSPLPSRSISPLPALVHTESSYSSTSAPDVAAPQAGQHFRSFEHATYEEINTMIEILAAQIASRDQSSSSSTSQCDAGLGVESSGQWPTPAQIAVSDYLGWEPGSFYGSYQEQEPFVPAAAAVDSSSYLPYSQLVAYGAPRFPSLNQEYASVSWYGYPEQTATIDPQFTLLTNLPPYSL